MSSIKSDQLITEYYESDASRQVNIRDEAQDAIPFDRIQCEDIRFVGQAWLDLPRNPGEALPDWKSFKPANFKKVLPKFCVIQVVDWRADKLEFTLVGSHVVDFIGGGRTLNLQKMRNDPKGQKNYLDIKSRIGRAIDQSAPQYVRKTLSWDDQDFIEYETMMLPFKPSNGIQRVLSPLSARIDRKRMKFEGLGAELQHRYFSSIKAALSIKPKS